jgi:hypothetical protein
MRCRGSLTSSPIRSSGFARRQVPKRIVYATPPGRGGSARRALPQTRPRRAGRGVPVAV